MEQSTNLSSKMYYTIAGIAVTLTLQDSLDNTQVNFNNTIPSEVVKYLSEVNCEVAYMEKIELSLNTLKDTGLISSFDILEKEDTDITTYLINVPKSKDIQKLIHTNMSIAEVFDVIPEQDREKFTTIQQMV